MQKALPSAGRRALERDRADSPAPGAASKKKAGEKVTSPRGDEFDVAGTAGPVRYVKTGAVLAEAGGDVLVIKEGAIFMCCSRNGDISPAVVSGEGLYTDDTRFLSEFTLKLGGVEPVLLSSSADLAYAMGVDLTNPNLRHDKSLIAAQQTLSLRRYRFLSDRLYERITIRNYSEEPVETSLDLTMAADFADMFEVRGSLRRNARGQLALPKPTEKGVNFGYVGVDGVFRETVVEMFPEPDMLQIIEGRAMAQWAANLAPDEEMEIVVSVEPSVSGKRRRARSIETAESRAVNKRDRWMQSGTSVVSDNELFDGFVRSSMRDLWALNTPVGSGEIIAAGIPWYVAPFGRDSLWTCCESLMLSTKPAKQTLKLLARYQARKSEAWRDAEPGKILHEIRSGELAGMGVIPHTPYYGSVDSTPLFLLLAASYYQWTGDLETMSALRPSLDAALKWVADFGDLDGDGFIEYNPRPDAALRNQGWKDSEDSIVHLDGSFPEGPLALVEAQGYVYKAKTGLSPVYEALGSPDIAGALRWEADNLKKTFNEAFWMPDEGTYALALDGNNNQVKTVTSNPGHGLFCGIVDEKKAPQLVGRLMAPDMFSGWGIRTLSTSSKVFNPMSYHNGSVWPHDNAIIAAGLKQYGYADEMETIASSMFDAAVISRELRLPELFCGFDRKRSNPFVAFPVACSPQAWASAAVFLLLQSLLGLSADAENNLLTIFKPRLPSWLHRLEVSSMTVGDSKLTLEFTSVGDVTSFSLKERSGHLRVMVEK